MFNSSSEIINGSCLDINIYKTIPLGSKTNKKGRSILIYVRADLIYKIRKDLSIYGKDKEILVIEIISKESKHMLLSCCYRPPNDITENLITYLTSILQRRVL